MVLFNKCFIATLLILGSLSANISSIENSLLHSLMISNRDTLIETTPYQEQKKETATGSYKVPGRAMLFSGLVPGAGQAYLGTWKRSLLFAGIEAAALGTWYHYTGLGDDLQKDYKTFANGYWTFANWLHDYYKWYDYDEDINWLSEEEWADLRYIFVNYSDSTIGCADDPTLPICYPDIWESSHNISFTWTHDDIDYPRFVRSSDDIFKEIYATLCGNPQTYMTECQFTVEEIVNSMVEYNVEIIMDHHFYENIGKYDGFFGGWSDNDSLYLVEKSTTELLAMSPNKRQYRDMWEKANDEYYKVAGFALSTLMANHVGSMLDALLSAKFINMKNEVDISAQPYYDRHNKWGVGGVKLIFKW